MNSMAAKGGESTNVFIVSVLSDLGGDLVWIFMWVLLSTVVVIGTAIDVLSTNVSANPKLTYISIAVASFAMAGWTIMRVLPSMDASVLSLVGLANFAAAGLLAIRGLFRESRAQQVAQL